MRVKRERQIDRTSGRLERNRRERRTREAAIYASQKSPTNRARPLKRRIAEKREQRKDGELKGEKNRTNRISHSESEINRKEITIMLIRI